MGTLPFDDFDAMAVLADELSAAGDPRGELMALQLALENGPHGRVGAEIERHLARHGRALLGPLHLATSLLELRWARGYLVEAKVASLASAPVQTGASFVPKSSRVPWAVKQLLAHESARVLSILRLEMEFSAFGTEQLLLAVDAVAANPRSLKVLSVHYRSEPYLWWNEPERFAEASGEVCGVQVFTDGDALLEEIARRIEAKRRVTFANSGLQL